MPECQNRTHALACHDPSWSCFRTGHAFHGHGGYGVRPWMQDVPPTCVSAMTLISVTLIFQFLAPKRRIATGSCEDSCSSLFKYQPYPTLVIRSQKDAST